MPELVSDPGEVETWHIARGGVFDGTELHPGAALRVAEGHVLAIEEAHRCAERPKGVVLRDHGDALLAPGLVDLQVNGGGGMLLNDAPTPAGVARICAAHLAEGTGTLLPTLVTDRPEVAERAVTAVESAQAEGCRGVAGLHLEGPHFTPARRGAHDPELVRPMTEADLGMLLDAARRLRVLMVTLAPDIVSPEIINRLARAGVIVSLGHSDADYETCRAALRAGARSVTHLFNAMSQVTGRAPGLVGAGLTTPGVHLGLIADAHHVHPANLDLAFRAKGAEGLYLVTDAMAAFGTEEDHFHMGGRLVQRREGRLTLPDGTLAGADLTLDRAVEIMMRHTAADLPKALAMATSGPAALIGRPELGRLRPGDPVPPLVLLPMP